jgi:hypothetical protein
MSGKVWENARKSGFSDFESDAFNHSATLPTVDFIGLNAGFHICQFAFSILEFHTIRMNVTSTDKPEPRWQKTPVANLMRHLQSGNYYARIRVRGKLIWKSLKTDRISVAKLRLGDFHKEERQRAEATKAVARGKMTFADALQT